jgi:hypothetical protein
MSDTIALLDPFDPQSIGRKDEGAASLGRWTVRHIRTDGGIDAQPIDGDTIRRCEILRTGAPPPLLAVGDTVLVWTPSSESTLGVVLGRVGETLATEAVPDELVIEAGNSLTLRCGSGSLTIRDDGRVLLKGRDVVSHATRLNRVRGGAVTIN